MKEKIALALFAVTALLTMTLGVSPLPDAQDRLHALPRAGLDFTSREVPLTPSETAVLGKAKVIKRLYQVRDQGVVVMVIDGGSKRHAVHDPVYCFRGAGWTVRERQPFALEGGAAVRLKLARGPGEEHEAMYWISDDQNRYVEPWRYWWETTLRRLTFGRSGPEPAMVMLQPAAPGPFDWQRLTDSFPVLMNF